MGWSVIGKSLSPVLWFFCLFMSDSLDIISLSLNCFLVGSICRGIKMGELQVVTGSNYVWDAGWLSSLLFWWAYVNMSEGKQHVFSSGQLPPASKKECTVSCSENCLAKGWLFPSVFNITLRDSQWRRWFKLLSLSTALKYWRCAVMSLLSTWIWWTWTLCWDGLIVHTCMHFWQMPASKSSYQISVYTWG